MAIVTKQKNNNFKYKNLYDAQKHHTDFLFSCECE